MHLELYGLAYCCPEIDRKANCPFKEMDNLLFKEKTNRINGLSNESKTTMLISHKVCFVLRNKQCICL